MRIGRNYPNSPLQPYAGVNRFLYCCRQTDQVTVEGAECGFEDELELAYAVIDGIQARAESRGNQVERFRFPANLVPS